MFATAQLLHFFLTISHSISTVLPRITNYNNKYSVYTKLFISEWHRKLYKMWIMCSLQCSTSEKLLANQTLLLLYEEAVNTIQNTCINLWTVTEIKAHDMVNHTSVHVIHTDTSVWLDLIPVSRQSDYRWLSQRSAIT